MKVLVLSLTCLFVVVGMAMAQTPTVSVPPDFSYLWKTSSESLKRFGEMNLGKFSDHGPYDVPESVKKVFLKTLVEEWNSKFNFYSKILHGAEAANKLMRSDFFIKSTFLPIAKIDLPSDFGKKVIYVLGVQGVKNPTNQSYFLLLFDPATGSCSNSPTVVEHVDNFRVNEYGDFLGDGKSVLAADTNIHIGSIGRNVVRFFALNKDFSIREMFAYEESQSNQDGEIMKNKFDKNSPDWQRKIKEFDPVKAEEYFHGHWGRLEKNGN